MVLHVAVGGLGLLVFCLLGGAQVSPVGVSHSVIIRGKEPVALPGFRELDPPSAIPESEIDVRDLLGPLKTEVPTACRGDDCGKADLLGRNPVPGASWPSEFEEVYGEFPTSEAASTPEVDSHPAPGRHAHPVQAVASPMPTPTEPLTVRASAPVYPMRARRRGFEGFVVLRVRVSATGKPVSVQVVGSSGHDVLDDAAVKAVWQWEFRPATVGGNPVEAELDIPIRFRLVE